MTSEKQDDGRRRGRPPGLGKRDLSGNLDEIRLLLPEAKLSRNDLLCRAMRKYLHAAPNETAFSSIVNGNRSLSSEFLTALHYAFVRAECYSHDHVLAALHPEVWLEPRAEFRMKILASIEANSYRYFKILAETAPWIKFRSSQLQAHIGDQTDYDVENLPTIYLGEELSFRVDMPFEGYLTILSYDPDPLPGQQPTKTFWLDPRLGLDGEPITAGLHEMPRNGRGIKAVGQPSRSALIGVATRSRIALPWTPDWKGALPPDDLRRLNVAVATLPADERSVAILDFIIRDRPSR